MNRFTTSSLPATPESTLIARLIAGWLCCGLAGVALLPEARAHSAQFGWIAYWLVGAPLLMWAMQCRRSLAAQAWAILVGLCLRGATDVAGTGSPFDRRQGWRHVRSRPQAKRLRR